MLDLFEIVRNAQRNRIHRIFEKARVEIFAQHCKYSLQLLLDRRANGRIWSGRARFAVSYNTA